MKKILLLLLFTAASYGQALFDEGIQIKNNVTDNSATKVNVQSTDGTINTISKSDLVNVVEVNDVPSLPLVGEVGRIYVVKNLNKIYRWNGTFYQELAATDISGLQAQIDLKANDSDVLHKTGNETKNGVLTLFESTGNDINNVLVGKNNAGTTTFSVKGNGDLSGNDTTLNSANITNSASINSLSVGANPIHSDGTIVVREGVTGNYGTATQEVLQNIIGIGGDQASNPSVLLFQGDSMTAGVPPADPYPDSIVTANIFDKENNAVGSKTIATIRTEALTLDDVLYRFAARENIYILWAGTNDLYNTYDVATTFKNLEATCRERQKKGFKVIVLTTLPRCGFAADGITTMASLILDYNTLIRQRWSTFADNIADVASNITLNSVNPCIDTTYYNGDGIHLTNTGNALLLPYVQNAINELSVQTTFQDVNIRGNIVQPVTIKKAFGTSETALTINNTSELNGNLGAIDFKARNAGFGDNGLTSRIEAVSNGASIGQTVLNIKVAENAVSLSTILSMDGVTKNSTFSGALSATSYTGGATLTGTPTAPTATAGTNTTQIATTAFVQANSKPYKVYTALLTQTGTNAPVATVLENTLGGTVVWTRSDIGQYVATLTGAFTVDKTIVFATTGQLGTVLTNTYSISVNTVSVDTFSTIDTAFRIDDAMLKSAFEIRVYDSSLE